MGAGEADAIGLRDKLSNGGRNKWVDHPLNAVGTVRSSCGDQPLRSKGGEGLWEREVT